MNEPTLVVLAAGMGSRYGGLKQIDPVHKNGEIIIDYSIYDAVKAGFKKAVFLINPLFEQEFKSVVGDRFNSVINVQYAFQRKEAFVPPELGMHINRSKPWGTGHAILCCKDIVNGAFAIINADDYYGQTAYKLMYDYLCSVDSSATPMPFSMVGYLLKNTVTAHGKVARGICKTENNTLCSVVERTWIEKDGDNAKFSENNGTSFLPLSGESIVSMNLWGFTDKLFGHLETQFSLFLENCVKIGSTATEKDEFFIPSVVSSLVERADATVEVMQSADTWYGVTYKEDKQSVVDALNMMILEGKYPDKLW